jgi:hypothetical protein
MHRRGEDGSPRPIGFELLQESEFFMGGGGLYGTEPDHLRFLRLVLNGGALDDARMRNG